MQAVDIHVKALNTDILDIYNLTKFSCRSPSGKPQLYCGQRAFRAQCEHTIADSCPFCVFQENDISAKSKQVCLVARRVWVFQAGFAEHAICCENVREY
eukprot:4282853-Amphidinium_carterae.1